jgi:hypothetical protein
MFLLIRTTDRTSVELLQERFQLYMDNIKMRITLICDFKQVFLDNFPLSIASYVWA